MENEKNEQNNIESIKIDAHIEDIKTYNNIIKYIFIRGEVTLSELIKDFKEKIDSNMIIKYLDIIKNAGSIEIQKIENDLNDRKIISLIGQEEETVNKNIEKWGKGYSTADIYILESIFDMYINGDASLGIQGFELKSADSYQSLLSVCKNKLLIRKLEERQLKGENVSMDIKRYSDVNKALVENAKLTEKQRTGVDYNLSTIGGIIKQVEMGEYIYPDNTIPDDEIDIALKLLSHTIANGGEDKLWCGREGKIAQSLIKEFGNSEV